MSFTYIFKELDTAKTFRLPPKSNSSITDSNIH